MCDEELLSTAGRHVFGGRSKTPKPKTAHERPLVPRVFVLTPYSYFRLLFSLPLDRVDSAGVLGEPKSMEKS